MEDTIELRKPVAQSQRFAGSLALLTAIMLIGMTTYEWLKQLLLPDITLWQSHIITIMFSTSIASIAGFFVLREHTRLQRRLAEEIAERTYAQEQQEQLIGELRAALANVKTLRGLLPICASCKKIRDDTGYWNQIETYIRTHSEAQFSHGLCPDCVQRLYPDLPDEDRAGGS
jgi:hypothetical protein